MRFGILKLDEIVEEVENGRIILIEEVGDIGFRLALKFLKNALNSGYDVYAIVPSRLRRDIEKEMRCEVITPNKDFTLHELFTISLTVKKIGDRVGLFNILQNLLTIHSAEKIYQLFQEICEIVRDKRGIMIVMIDKRLLNSSALAMFESESDYVIDLEERINGLKVKRGIRIKKNPKKPPSDFYELIIAGKDIDVGNRIE